MITIYTDGSCRGNPGPGGFGVIVVKDDKILSAHSEQFDSTTNNRMEMMAIIYALKHYGGKEQDFFIPIVYSDSDYCVKTFTSWMYTWKSRGWKRAGNKKVENLDLVKEYYELSQLYKIDLRKVKGHAGERYNELADSLARGLITEKDILK